MRQITQFLSEGESPTLSPTFTRRSLFNFLVPVFFNSFTN